MTETEQKTVSIEEYGWLSGIVYGREGKENQLELKLQLTEGNLKKIKNGK